MAIPQTDLQWLDRMYRELFGRPADAAGVATFTQLLNQGETRDQVLGRLVQSAEFGGGLSVDDQIRKLYRSFLGREASGDDIYFWRAKAWEYGGFQNIVPLIRNSAEGLAVQESRYNPATPTPDQDPIEPGPPAGPDPDRISAKSQIDAVLDRYGLGELKDWAWSRIVDEASPDQIMNELYDPTTEAGQVFDRYFPEFELLRQKRNSGTQVTIPSIDELLATRDQYAQIMRQAGLPSGFYDEPSDFTNLIVNQRSPVEVAEVINEGWRRVTQAPAEVRAAFGRLYGIDGDAALAAEFLDPTKANPLLIEMARTAEVAGTADRFGVGLGLDRAQRVASLQLSRQEYEQGFAQLDSLAGLFQETLSETEDLTPEGAGVEAIFNLSAGARDRIERRRSTRVNLLSGGGGVAETRTGLGVGSAE